MIEEDSTIDQSVFVSESPEDKIKGQVAAKKVREKEPFVYQQ